MRLVLGVKQPHTLDAAVAVHLADLKRHVQRDVAALRRLEHLPDRHLVGAEALAPVHQGDRAGRVEQVHHPVAG